MAAYGEMPQAIPGLRAGLDHFIETVYAREVIAFGRPVMGYAGDEMNGYNLHADRSTGLFSADFVASNSIAVTINTIAVTPVVFSVDQATTRAAVIAAINANASLVALGISAAPGAGTRDIVVKGKGLDIAFSAVVTLGASQATMTATLDTWALFLGIADWQHKASKTTGGGNSAYQINDDVGVGVDKYFWVETPSANVQDKEKAYAIFTPGSTQGTFTNVSSGNLDIGCVFRTNRNSDNLAKLQIRGIKV